MPYPKSGPAADHGPSVRNPATYEALINSGHSKSSAAAISNAALRKGHKKGRHHKGRRGRSR